MDKYHRNRLAMLQNVVEHFDDHPTLWQDTPPLADNVAQVRAATDAMLQADQKKSASDTRGHTQAKGATRTELNQRLADMGDLVTAYAIHTGVPARQTLTQTADRSKSEWGRMPETAFASNARAALDAVEPHLSGLADFGVTADTLAALRSDVDAYAQLAPERANLSADESDAVAAIAEAYRSTLEPFDVLDRIVPLLISDVAFVREYEVLRRIPGE
jgi:hypothetical protein